MTQKRMGAAEFRWERMLRLSTFQIGSAMGDILVTSIWNRIMITHLGIPAWPVGLLIALRYLLSPLSLWAGHQSDSQKFLGFYRTSYILIGRFMIVLSLPLLLLSVSIFEEDVTNIMGWVWSLVSFLLYGAGTLLSGSPFLALVRDSAPPDRQGFAISVAETVLIIFFAITGISFSLWMPEYDPQVFRTMVFATMIIGGFFWFFAVWGVEYRSISEEVRASTAVGATSHSLRETFKEIWGDHRTRRFFFFLSLSTLAAWMQDVILEPFGGEVLGRSMEVTTRFNSYWQTATVIFLIGVSAFWRKRPPEQQASISNWGLSIMAAGMGLLAVESFSGGLRIVELALIVFGAGFGVYTFGGLSLMAVMSSDKDAGAYLGLWTISILIFKGLGNFLGTVIRDLFLQLGFSGEISYGVIFLTAAVGLLGSVWILNGLDVLGFARDHGRIENLDEVQRAGVEL